MDGEVKSILGMIKWRQDEINKQKRFIHNLEVELKDKLQNITGLENPVIVYGFWGWDCPDSPVETCVYDGNKDPCHDCCIYCFNPFERK